MSELRMLFEKKGRAKYLSQLDCMHTLTRAFTRAGFKLKYSQGFNPHPRLSVAHPLPVGVEGYAEMLDFDVDEELPADALERLNARLPDGIKGLKLYTPDVPVKAYTFGDYQLEFIYDGGVPDGVAEVFERENIPVTKKSKSGMSEINLRTVFSNMSELSRTDRSVRFSVRLDAKNAPINPRYFADALENAGMKPDFARYARTGFVMAE